MGGEEAEREGEGKGGETGGQALRKSRNSQNDFLAVSSASAIIYFFIHTRSGQKKRKKKGGNARHVVLP